MSTGPRDTICRTIDDHKDELIALSGEIWKNPELSFEEFKAHELLTDYLEKKGFAVERSYTGIETAFRATYGSGSPNVCVICEYDALPAWYRTRLWAQPNSGDWSSCWVGSEGCPVCMVSSQGEIKGRLTVLGTPAEESGGGKILLIKNGAFDDVDVAMMVHPTPLNIVFAPFLAMCVYQATYKGKPAHASARPWEGVNALDAAVLAYNSISALRQQMKPDWRVHGVITEGGLRSS